MKNLIIDPTTFKDKFPHEPFIVKHGFAEHALFSLPRLVELSKTLPEENVEYNSGKVSVNLDPAKTPKNGLSVEETIRRIEECSSWMVLKNVEQDPSYAQLLNETLATVAPYTSAKVGKMEQLEAFIFISSPGSVTPYHMDPEHNFLLQIRGEKTVYMFNGQDPTILPDEELERYYSGGHRNLVCTETIQARGVPYKLLAGDGLHFPINDPHWVKNGNAVSISFSITFRSPYSQKRSRLYFLNSRIRKLGMKPTRIGEVAWRDSAKYGVWKALHSVKNLGQGQRST